MKSSGKLSLEAKYITHMSCGHAKPRRFKRLQFVSHTHKTTSSDLGTSQSPMSDGCCPKDLDAIVFHCNKGV